MATDPVHERAVQALRQAFDEAHQRGETDHNAAALATAGRDGRPSVRTVTIVRLADTGLAFFATRDSGKGRQLAENPRAALCFRWPHIQMQVTVEGAVAPLPDAEADRLWLQQPRDVGLARWAADPEAPEGDLRERVAQVRDRFADARVPRPARWQAYELAPDSIDLWPSGWHRLRARHSFGRGADGRWTEAKLGP